MSQVAKTLDDVENAYSGVPNMLNPPKAFHGRMYPPQADSIKQVPGGGLQAQTKGHVIEAGPNGSIKITDKQGALQFTKPGGR